MRKHLLCLACLMMVLVCASPCQAASPIKWQLEWMETGELREEVRIPVEITEAPSDKSWNRNQEGSEWVFHRNIQGWSNYQSHNDGLPLKINENKNILYGLTVIQTDPQSPQDWFEKIAGSNELQLTIEVPGLILTSTADRRDDLFSSWFFTRGADLGSEGVILKVVRIDGLVMGIGIVTIGLILAVVIFYRRVKKAEQIIAETYAIPPKNSNPTQDELE
ncbi:MAG: hypothetical protein ABRQ24_07715 [Syntrophomonadaceae bacterium]